MITSEELEQLFLDQESDRVERKPSLSDKSEIKKNICAFANDLPGHGKPGIIFMGVSDDGQSTGLAITDELLKTLSTMSLDGNILPPPTLIVQKHTIRGRDVAVVMVEPSLNPPVRFDGRVWVRVGSTRHLATLQDEQHLIERRRSADLPFDCRPVKGSTVEDLNTDFFIREYLPSAVASDVLEKNQRSLEQQLTSLRFLSKEGIPTYGAVLLFCKDPLRWIPGDEVQFLRIQGRSLAGPIKDQKRLSGPLYQILEQLDELLKLNISIATDVTSGSKEIQRPDYPLAALRQITRNALMHRSYENTHAPVKIHWFEDYIEISNPGGLYGQVNPQNFGKGATDYRNPLIAEAMRVLGYVQRFGLGIPLAKSELGKNGNPPAEFDFQLGMFLVRIKARQ